jgi:2-polyprenyl-3-methyl-5-hydroxy-6-metoxy-1,4-benzoquinol methylase
MQFQTLTNLVSEIDPNLALTIDRIEAGWQTGESGDLEMTQTVAGVLLSCIDAKLFSAEAMVTGFNAFSDDFFERQMDCIRTKGYRAKDYEKLKKEIYANDDYMATTYYPALLLSYLASPNYRHILRVQDFILNEWASAGKEKIIDIASGHGFLLILALRKLSNASGISVDISPVAAKFAGALVKCTGWANGRLRAVTQDFLADQPGNVSGSFDAAICCELLEHVPNPADFLRAIRNSLKPEGRLFVSAAVRMESIDHLSYFDTDAAVAELIERNGFRVLKEMSVPFVSKRPSTEKKWAKLVADPLVPVTYVAECAVG